MADLLEARDLADKTTIGETNCPSGYVDGDNTQLDGRHEPEMEPRLGTREKQAWRSGVSTGDDSTMRIPDVLDRFVQQSKTCLKQRTMEAYSSAFRMFAEECSLEQYTRRQLAGTKGRTLIMAHMEHVTRPTWRWENAALKSVWTYGLNLPWPIDSRRDFGRLPKTRRRETPPDSVVKAWAEALGHEPDPYLRLVWQFIAQCGWRPSHVGHLKWRNVRYDSSGKPVAIIADGFEEDFKTNALVAARLCPEVVEALAEWKKVAPEQLAERPIIPWRRGSKGIQPSKAQSRTSLIQHWIRLEERWRLPHLRMCDLRHWVATACRRASLSKQASGHLMGHDVTMDGGMRDWYDHPMLEDILAEQAEKLPHGPLGLLEPVRLEPLEGLTPESMNLLRDYMTSTIGTMEFANRIEAVRLKIRAEEAPSLER